MNEVDLIEGAMSHVNQLQQLQAGGQHLKPEPEKKITN
jgi:hypothetical protein